MDGKHGLREWQGLPGGQLSPSEQHQPSGLLKTRACPFPLGQASLSFPPLLMAGCSRARPSLSPA